MHEVLFAKSGLSLDRLRVLVAVANAGSIVKAAGDDPVRQSQYSRQLKELETFFGQKLTERKGRTLNLTPSGQRLANLSREQFNALAHFKSENGQMPLTVRIGAGESLIKWLLIPNLGHIKTARDSVNWRFANLQTPEIMERLLDQRLDFGLVRGVEETPPLKSARLGRLSSALFVPKKMTVAMPARPETAITQLPMAILEGRSRMRQMIEDACRKAGRPHSIRFECASQPEIAVVVRHGLAAGILPTLAGDTFAGSDVQMFDLSRMKVFDIELSLVWNPRTLALSETLERIKGDLDRVLRQGGLHGAGSRHSSAEN